MADHEHEEASRTVHAGGNQPTESHLGVAGGGARESMRNGGAGGPVIAARAPILSPPVIPDRIGADINGRDIAAANGLADTIREKIVPRLLSLSDTPGAISTVNGAIPADVVSAVAEAAVAGELGVVQSHLHAHTLKGGSLADALILLIGGAAAQLGEDWEHDTRDFMEVTIGLGTLQAAILAVSDPDEGAPESQRKVLLGASPGDDHTLGLAIVNHFFRQAGWSVSFMPYAGEDELVAAAANRWFTVAGISVASDSLVPAASRTVAALRQRSMNQRIKIMVGGPLVKIDPNKAKRIGGDTLVHDGRRAVVWAERLAEYAVGAGPVSRE